MCAEIPLPVTFNPWKHHFRFLLKEVENWRTKGWESAETKILTIGLNLIDLYTGPLTIDEICNESIALLKAKNLFYPEQYKNWLAKVEWQKIALSDGSKWLLKIGDQPHRYLHIHPAKYSDFSIRVRATTLKTVLALECSASDTANSEGPLLETVNRVRVEKLGLSPVKALPAKNSGIIRLLRLFQNTEF